MLISAAQQGDSYIYIHIYVYILYIYKRTSQVALVVKNLPANAGDARDAGTLYLGGRFRILTSGKHLMTYSCIHCTFLLVTVDLSHNLHLGMEDCLTQF